MDETGRLALKLHRRTMFIVSTKYGLPDRSRNLLSAAHAKAEPAAWNKLRACVAKGCVLLKGEPYIPSIARERNCEGIKPIPPELAMTLELDNENGNCQLRPRHWEKKGQYWWRKVAVDLLGHSVQCARGTSANSATLAKPSSTAAIAPKESSPHSEPALSQQRQVIAAKLRADGLTGKTLEVFNLITEMFGPEGPPQKFGAKKIKQRIEKEGSARHRAIEASISLSTIKVALRHVRAKSSSESV